MTEFGRFLRPVLAACVAAALVAGPAGARADAVLDKLYEAAKAEGKVSVICAPSAPLRKELIDAFTKRFPGIELEIQGLAGDATVNKIRSEDRAAVRSIDVILTGTATIMPILKPAKLIRPLDPMIISAEARDPSKWRGGALGWADEDKTTLAMTTIALPNTLYNTDLVKPGALSSDKDLLDPKWKGKIVINDPTAPGAANIVFRHFYDLHGEQFIRAFMKQEPVVTKDLRQLVDWVAKGTYPIAVGFSPTPVNVFLQQGVKNIAAFSEWKDALVLSPGFGGLLMPTNVPHPAAAQLFVNWVLTQEGQTAVVKGLSYPSRRLDVSQDYVAEYLRPIPGRTYTEAYTEAWIKHPNDSKLRELYKELKVGVR